VAKSLTLNPAAITRRLNAAGIRRVYSYKRPVEAEVYVGADGGGMSMAPAVKRRFDHVEQVLRDAGYDVTRTGDEGVTVRLIPTDAVPCADLAEVVRRFTEYGTVTVTGPCNEAVDAVNALGEQDVQWTIGEGVWTAVVTPIPAVAR
jgi:hypothetical protein